jgi:hypothetical protein
MLISKGFSQGDVISIKLTNGDELITRFESEDADSIIINRPLALTMSKDGLGMIPWMFLGASETITLNKLHTYCITISKKEAANQYLEGTTGISLVK